MKLMMSIFQSQAKGLVCIVKKLLVMSEVSHGLILHQQFAINTQRGQKPPLRKANMDPRTKVIPAGSPVVIHYNNQDSRKVFLDYPHFFDPKDMEYSVLFKSWSVLKISKSIYSYEVNGWYIKDRKLMEVA